MLAGIQCHQRSGQYPMALAQSLAKLGLRMIYLRTGKKPAEIIDMPMDQIELSLVKLGYLLCTPTEQEEQDLMTKRSYVPPHKRNEHPADRLDEAIPKNEK